MNKRVIVVHGWGGGSTDNWLPWLKSELEKLGHEVLVPDMPDTDSPVIEKWLDYLSKVVGTPDRNTFFIGHSIGCQAILRYLETIDKPVGGAIFVAGWFDLDVDNEEEEKIAKPWVERAINLEKVGSVLPKSILIISDDDPHGSFEENKKKFEEFGSKIVVLHKAEHITGTSEPAILSEFSSLVAIS